MMVPRSEQKFTVPPRRLAPAADAPAQPGAAGQSHDILAAQMAPASDPARRFAWISHRMVLAAILLLALVLRFNKFRQPLVDAFSWRQSSTAMMALNFYQDSFNVFFPAVNWGGPEPAYTGREFQTVTILAAVLYHVFGPDDWIGRAICATFGVWGVFALHRLTRRVWGEPRAHAAALMLAILPGAVLIDRSFLPDPAMLALTTTTVWVYVAFLQTGRRQYLYWAGALAIVAFLTKLPGIVTLVPMAYATVSILRQQGRLNWAALRPIVGVVAVALVPIGLYYAWAVYLGTHYPPYHVAGGGNWLNSLETLGWMIDQAYFLPKFSRHLSTWLWTVPVIALVVLGALFSPRTVEATERPADDDPRAPGAPWLFHFWALGFGVLYLIGARELVVNPWNLHVFNTVGAALAGQGLVLLVTGRAVWQRRHSTAPILDGDGIRRWIAPSLRLAVIVGVILVHQQSVFASMTGSSAMNGYRLGQALERVSKKGETVVTIADDVGDPVAILYSRRRGWVFPPAHRQDVWPEYGLMPPDDALSIQMFEEIRNAGADWLGIVANPKDDTPGRRDFWKDHPQFVEHINRTCEVTERTRNYVIYRIRPPQELAALQPATQP